MTSTSFEQTEFYQSFPNTGTFVFGDYSAPDQYTTIVRVVSNDEICDGFQSYPITPSNMVKLGITATRP